MGRMRSVTSTTLLVLAGFALPVGILAAWAAAVAATPRSTTMAFSWGFTARMRSTTSAITSAQVNDPRWYPSISSVAERFQWSMRPGW